MRRLEGKKVVALGASSRIRPHGDLDMRSMALSERADGG